jgi:hypothetical protein
MLGAVAHIWNQSYLRGRDQEDMFKVNPGKKLARPHLSQQTRCGGVHIYVGSHR